MECWIEGQNDTITIEIYTHVTKIGLSRIKSPIDEIDDEI